MNEVSYHGKDLFGGLPVGEFKVGEWLQGNFDHIQAAFVRARKLLDSYDYACGSDSKVLLGPTPLWVVPAVSKLEFIRSQIGAIGGIVRQLNDRFTPRESEAQLCSDLNRARQNIHRALLSLNGMVPKDATLGSITKDCSTAFGDSRLPPVES